MNIIDSNLLALKTAIVNAQSALSDMSTAIVNVQLQIGDTERQASQIESDIGTASVNTRDRIITLLVGSVPKEMLDKLSALQPLTDAKGTYLRDEKNNFLIR